MLRALIFDFDGIVLDTETPLVSAWESTFRHFGAQPISLADWVASIGLHEDDPARLDPVARLAETLGHGVGAAEVQRARRRLRDDILDASPLRAGIEALLSQCEELNLATAIASSSPRSWIERHLGPRGALDRFDVLSCATAGVPGKPDPAVYINACQSLGLPPEDCLAIEDSIHGVTAAREAGVRCIAAPTPITTGLDFSDADATVTSLEDIDLAPWQHTPREASSRTT